MGFLFSLRIIGYFFSSSFVGIITDKTSKKKLVMLGSTGRGIAYFIMYLSIILINLPLLMVSNLTLGFMAGFFWIPFDALIADKSIDINRSQAYGLRTSAQGQGVFYGAMIGFSLLLFFQPNRFLMYIAIPVFGVANIYASWKVHREITDEKLIYPTKPEEKNLLNNAKRPLIPKIMLIGLMFLLTVILLESINGSLAKPFILPYFIENFTNDVSIASFIYIPVGLVSILLAPKLGRLVDKMNLYTGITVLAILGATTTFLLININSIIIFSLLLTVDEGIVITSGLILSNIFSRISIKHRGKIIGANAFITNFGGIIGPIAGGFLWQYYSEKAPFIVSIGIEFLIIPFFILSLVLLSPYFEEKIIKEKDRLSVM